MECLHAYTGVKPYHCPRSSICRARRKSFSSYGKTGVSCVKFPAAAIRARPNIAPVMLGFLFRGWEAVNCSFQTRNAYLLIYPAGSLAAILRFG